MVAIVGPSGSGKSTLMNILGCLDRPSGGSYRVSGRETAALDADALAALRREHFGFIFQHYRLLAELTALGNVEIPAIYAGLAPRERRARAAALLTRLGMAERLEHPPRSEEHTSELQSLMRISYAVLCLKQNNITTHFNTRYQ